MDWDIQQRSVVLRYDTTGFTNGALYGQAVVGDFGVNPTLLHRKIWCAVFSVPDADSYAQYRSTLFVTAGGTEKPLVSWFTRNNQGLLDVPGNANTLDNDQFARISAPFSVLQDGFGDVDKGPIPACGPDARVMAFQVGSKSAVQSSRPIFRATMFPVRITSAATRIRLVVSDVFGNNSSSTPPSPSVGNTGNSFTGYVVGALVVQSQLRPE